MKSNNWVKVDKPNLYKRHTPNGVEYMHKQNFKTPDGKSQAYYGYSSNEHGLTPKKDWERIKADTLKNWDKTSKLDKQSTNATVEDLSTSFLKESESFKANTYLRRKQKLTKYILPVLGDIKLKDLDKKTISKFYEDITTRKKPSVTKAVHEVLSPMIKWMLDLNYISDNPIPTTSVSAFTRMIKQEKQQKAIDDPEGDTLDMRDVQAILEEVKGTKDEIVWLMKIYQGGRPSECFGVDWNNIDLENKILHFTQETHLVHRNQLKGTRYDDGKSDRTTLIPLKNDGSSRSMPLMASYIQVLDKTPIEDRHGLVYTDKNGNPMNHENWNKKHVKPLLKKLGITKNYTTYSFRKFFASYNLNINQVPRNVIAKWMGHSDVTTTLKYYDKILDGTNNEYRMNDLTIRPRKVAEPVATAPTGYPNPIPLPLVGSYDDKALGIGAYDKNFLSNTLMKKVDGEFVWEKVGN